MSTMNKTNDNEKINNYIILIINKNNQCWIITQFYDLSAVKFDDVKFSYSFFFVTNAVSLFFEQDPR